MRKADMVIIGGGPAGLTAAIYASRAGLKPVIIEKQACGGQICYSPEVENFPGYAKISGSELSENMTDQAESLGAVIEYDEVTDFSVVTDGKHIKTLSGEEYVTDAVVIATGAGVRKLSLPREEELVGAGVSYCAVCDGAFFAGKTVAVNGGGNTALTDAIYLADICEKVYLIHRRDSYRAEPAVVEKLHERSNIVEILNSRVEALNGEELLTSITVSNVETGDRQDIQVDGLFVAVGRTPETALFKDYIDLDAAGYGASDERCLTRTPGVFIAGDCRNREVKQLTTAVCDGAVAALSAIDYLK